MAIVYVSHEFAVRHYPAGSAKGGQFRPLGGAKSGKLAARQEAVHPPKTSLGLDMRRSGKVIRIKSSHKLAAKIKHRLKAKEDKAKMEMRQYDRDHALRIKANGPGHYPGR